MRIPAKAVFLVGIAWLIAPQAVLSASYEQLRAAALKQCQAIDPAAYQGGLLFNPEGYRSFYVRSECMQKTAVEFRDGSICKEVKQRHSLFSSGWGYSPAQCAKLVREGIAADEQALTDMKQRYRRGAVRLHDFRLERNGNGRDFDVIPSFAGDYAHGYIFRLELVGPDDKGTLLHSSGYYLDDHSNLRIFMRQEEIRSRVADFVLGRLYNMRATLALEIGNGGQGGRWSEPFIEKVFPLRERSQSLEREVRF